MRCQKVWGQNTYLHETQSCMGHIFLSFTSQHICHSKTDDSTQQKPSGPRPYFHSPLLSAWPLEVWRAPGVEKRCPCFAVQRTTLRKRDGLGGPKRSPCQNYLYDPCTECKLFIQFMRWGWYSRIACDSIRWLTTDTTSLFSYMRWSRTQKSNITERWEGSVVQWLAAV